MIANQYPFPATGLVYDLEEVAVAAVTSTPAAERAVALAHRLPRIAAFRGVTPRTC
ncbi:hypothetical protein [Streptomyces sp. NPDC092307]|uniref:hypothetical protein n=1 Tax=Streptomyces sp. NPDC092307 TaxID=3366013 RepID=UPI0037FC075B